MEEKVQYQSEERLRDIQVKFKYSFFQVDIFNFRNKLLL